VLAISYLGLIVFIIIFEFTRKKDTKFDFLSLFHLFFILLYPLPGYFITNLNADNGQMIHPGIIGITAHDLQYSWKVPLAIFLTYFLVVFGYHSPSAKRYGEKININSRADPIIWIVVMVILLLGWISTYIYSSQYGGILQAISDANFIRSGAIEGQALGFFVRLLYFNFFASYLIAGLLFIKENQKKKIGIWILFILALTSSFIAAFMVSARATMILAFINFYLAYLLYKKKFALSIVIPLVIVVVLFIVYGKIMFYSLSGISEGGYIEVVSRFKQAATEAEGESSFFVSLINVFSYGFISIYPAFKEYYPLRLLSDWLYGIGSYLPDRLLEFTVPPSVSFNNSQYLLGHNDYEIPAGFIASCVYSWSWIGVIIFSFSYGWVGRYLHTILERHLYKICWIPFVYAAIAQAWSDFLASGDPTIFFQANFWVLCSLFFLLIFAVKVSTKEQQQL
jgi:hypothetical protein